MDSVLNGFSAMFESEAGQRYLVMCHESGLKIEGFQLEMAANNSIPGVLAFEIREKNSSQKIYYNLSGLVNLPNYLIMPDQSGDSILQLISRITSILLDSSKYLLDLHAFVLKKDFVFIEPKSGKPYLIFLPAEKDEDPIEAFKSLVKYLMSSYRANQPSDSLLRKLQEALTAESINLSDFSRQLKELIGSQGSSSRPPLTAESGMNADSPKEEPGEFSTGNGRKVRTRIFVSLGLVVILSVIAVYTGKVELPTAGLVLSVLVLAGAVLVRVTRNSPARGTEDSAIQAKTALEHQVEETVLLWETICPELEEIAGGATISLDRPECLIGRNSQLCDCILQNRSIGRIHAKIISSGGRYLLLDMDSKNGTFLNDTRIESNQNYEIKDGDKITFAEVDFRFWLQGSSRSGNYQEVPAGVGEVC